MRKKKGRGGPTFAAHIVVDVDSRLPIREVGNLRVGDADFQALCNLLGQRDVCVAADDPDLVVQRLVEIHQALR